MEVSTSCEKIESTNIKESLYSFRKNIFSLKKRFQDQFYKAIKKDNSIKPKLETTNSDQKDTNNASPSYSQSNHLHANAQQNATDNAYYGQPAYGQPAYGQPAYGQPGFGQPVYGMSQQQMGYGQQQYYQSQHSNYGASNQQHNQMNETVIAVQTVDNNGFYSYFIVTSTFEDRRVRHAFIQKVYTHVLVMLAVVVAMSAVATTVQPVGEWVHKNFLVLLLVGLALLIVLILWQCCDPNVTRKYPQNYVFMVLLTVSYAIDVVVVTQRTPPKVVLIAAGATLVVVLLLTLLACQAKFDVTGCYGFASILLVVLIIFMFLAVFLRDEFPILNLVYACFGAFVFSFYLLIDTQMLMSNKKNSFSVDDYVGAAIQLFIDIIMIFLYILKILNNLNND